MKARPRLLRRGSVLIVVLVTIMMATAALALFLERAGVDLLVDLREATARRQRQQAYSALEVTLCVLEEFRKVNDGLHSPAEGWGDPLAFAGWTPAEGLTVEVTFQDESGKMSLPRVQQATLIELFKSWELSQADAEKLTDGLLGWMRKDYVPTGTVSPDYDRVSLPYVTPGRSLRSFSELAAVDVVREFFFEKDGQPNDYWRRFTQAFSLFDFKEVNLNAASPDALAALGSYDLQQQNLVSDFLAGRGSYASQGPGMFRTTADAATLLGGKSVASGFGTDIRALRVNIAVRQGSVVYRLSVVVAPPSGATTIQATKEAPGDVSESDTSSATDSSSNSTQSGTSGNSATSTSSGTSGTSNSSNSSNTSSSTNSTSSDKKLNYPFTLLEITENVENTPPPPPPPADA